MKKICMITTVSITMKSFVVETAKYLHNECGYDVTLICNDDQGFRESLPEYLHFIPVEMSRGISLSGFKAIKVFKKIFQKEKFDLVQYSTPNASFYASIASKKAKVEKRLYCQWGMRYVGFSGIKRKIFKFLEKMVCKRSTHVFAVSPMNMQFAIDEKLYKKDKVRVVGNGGTIGVDKLVYDIAKKEEWNRSIREKYGIGENDFVFGFAGRASRDKGCSELLSAFQKLSDGRDGVKLMMVGPVEKESGIDEGLLDFANASDKVILTGRVNNSEMKEYYSAMNVLVHPTYREGFGMVIQEAGAMAVPVITTKIPGASEVMVDGESCVLVDAKDENSLLIAMAEMFEDGQKVESLAKSAYERTMTLYERQIMLANQKKEYESIIGE